MPPVGSSGPGRLGTWLGPAAVVAFVAGAAWRWLHLTQFHDPRRYVYSDMALYVELAHRVAGPGYVLRAADVTHPPGAAMLFGAFYARDPSLQSLVWFQLLVAVLVPLAVGALAGMAYGRRAAAYAVIVSSLYFPFVDYGGYFLAEIYLALVLPTTLALYLGSTRLASWPGRVGTALVAGIGLSAGMALKLVALPAIVGFATVHWLFFRGATRTRKAVLVLALLMGAVPGTILLAERCTRANDGRFCLVSNKGAADFLLGHYGRIQSITWRDPRGGAVFQFGSPSAYQRYRAAAEVPFAMTDGAANLQAAWGWIRAHPMGALVLSLEHVYDLFVGSIPWPSYATESWIGAEAAHFLFIVFLLFPALVFCLDTLRQHGVRAFLGSEAMLLLSPLLGLMAAAFVATGEPRYRVPFDGLLVILAVEFYRGLGPARRPLSRGADTVPTGDGQVVP